jgi:hypothetical protein
VVLQDGRVLGDDVLRRAVLLLPPQRVVGTNDLHQLERQVIFRPDGVIRAVAVNRDTSQRMLPRHVDA